MAATGPTVRTFAGPLTYVQGPDALDRLGDLVASYGLRPVVITDPFVRDLLGDRLASVLGQAGLDPRFRLLEGELTAAAADAITTSLDGTGAVGGSSAVGGSGTGVVIGVGGGKSLDAAKAVSLRLGLPVVTVPSIASNDSPTSRAVAMYDDQHRLVSVDQLPANPHAVVVDTALVARAPIRFLRAGVGDAVAKKFEAAGCLAGTGVTTLGSRPLLVGSALASACYDAIRAHAHGGLAANERGEPDEHLEALVEAVVLLSGLGFENGGLSVAHSLTRGLMRARGAQHALHGEQVAWATLVQRSVDGAATDEVAELTAFLANLGLPTTLAGLGMADPTPAEIDLIAAVTLTAPHLANVARQVTHAALVAAIRRLERR